MNEVIEKVCNPTIRFILVLLTSYYVFLDDEDKKLLERLNWIVFGYLLLVFTKKQAFKIVFVDSYFKVGDIIIAKGKKTKLIKLFNHYYIKQN